MRRIPCSIRFSMKPRESDISGDGDIFDGERAIGRAHVDIRVPSASSGERHKAERRSTARRMGAIWFQGQTPSGPPLDLIGKELTMRLDDGRTVEFVLFDSATIHVRRIT